MMNLGSEMFEGSPHDKCSVEDFITFMPAGSGSSVCQEFGLPNKMHPELRVFGYSSTSKFSASAGSLVEKFPLLIQPLYNFYGGSSLLQLWTPIRCSSGGVMLTVSEQPFAIQKLCKGLCRYRYSCLRQDINVEGALVGPIGKVFTQGYPACGDSASSSLSNCHFAKNPYGIGNDWRYLAFPLFERDDADNGQLQQCAGVLEISIYSSVRENHFWLIPVGLKDLGIECIRSDILECFKARCGAIESKTRWHILHDLRDKLKSPLMQMWLPCMCDTTSRFTHEFLCTRTSTDNFYIMHNYQVNLFSHGSGFIQNPLVGRAYSENKACYIRDTSLSFSDFPFMPVHFTLSHRSYACFVVQLKSIHPVLHPLVLEVFLPRLQNFPAQLNSLLSTIARELSKCNAAYGLQENEDFLVSSCHSDDDNVMYFEIHRSNKSMATDAVIGHGTEDSGQNCGTHDAFVNRVTSSRESLRSCDDVITMDGISIREEDEDPTDLQIIEELRKFPSINQEKQQFSPTTLEANDQSKSMPEDTAQTSREVFPNAEAEIAVDAIPSGEEVEVAAETFTVESSKKTCTVGEDEITLDMINQYRGRAKLEDAATKLNVSKSTLKRRCRKFGIRRWPHHKGNVVRNIQSSARLRKTNLFEIGGKVIQDSEIMECSNNDASSIPASAKGKSIAAENHYSTNHYSENHEIDRGYRLIVEASCRDDVAKFPFYSNSGIEQLRGVLVKRFELEGGRFKVKYKDEDDDGGWIILSCDEDLLFHIETLRASGQSTMRLSVFPVTL